MIKDLTEWWVVLHCTNGEQSEYYCVLRKIVLLLFVVISTLTKLSQALGYVNENTISKTSDFHKPNKIWLLGRLWYNSTNNTSNKRLC